MDRSVAFAVVAAIALFGCRKKPAVPDDPVLAAVRASVEASESERVDAYLATLDPQSNDLRKVRSDVEQTFRTYDLRYTLLSAEVSERTSDQARVSFVLRVSRRGGAAFSDHVTSGVWVMRRVTGAWTISRSEDVQHAAIAR